MNIIKSLVLIIVLLLFRVDSHGANIEPITANELITALEKQDEHNKILLFFTSWCPYCKSAIQQILDSKAQNKVTFISLDKNYSQIKTFASSLTDNITIYYIADQSEVVAFFNKNGIRYKGSIPYISILNADNHLIEDDVSLRQLQRYLK